VGAAAPLQEAAVTALELPGSYYAELLAGYSRKRELLLGYLTRAGLPHNIPEGAYYVMVGIGHLGFPTDQAAAEWIAKEIGVAGVPGSSFFHEPRHDLLRLHFAKREETLQAAGERLLRLASGR
jgi:aspartate/methionine/tyrosine aminotransferase